MHLRVQHEFHPVLLKFFSLPNHN